MNLYYKYNAAACIYHMLWDDLLQIWHLEQKHPDFNLIFDDVTAGRWSAKHFENLFPKMPDWTDWIKLVKKKNIIKLSETAQKEFDYNLKLTKSMDIKYEIEPKARYPLNSASSWHKVKTNYNLTDFANTILESLNIERNPNPQNCIFVERANGTRSVLNSSEVIDQLKSYGYNFTHHTLEGTDLRWQVKLFNDAKWVISPEGSNLTHEMFMQPKSKVTVIYPEQYRWESFHPMFCKVYDLEYQSVTALPWNESCISPNHEWCFKELRAQIADLEERVNYKDLYRLKNLLFHGSHISGDYPKEIISNRWLKNAVKNQNMFVDIKSLI